MVGGSQPRSTDGRTPTGQTLPIAGTPTSAPAPAPATALAPADSEATPAAGAAAEGPDREGPDREGPDREGPVREGPAHARLPYTISVKAVTRTAHPTPHHTRRRMPPPSRIPPPRPLHLWATPRLWTAASPGGPAVPYTSSGDPGHRVDFARPGTTSGNGSYQAPLGPSRHGARGRQARPPSGGRGTTEKLKEMAMAVVTMRELLESGVHFGHQTRRWNPKMKRFIFTERNGIYIIDLLQSLSYIDRAYEFVKETVAHGGTVMFVGTKKQAQEAIAEQATRVGMPFVNQRWLGGMLTNFSTVYKRLQRLKELEQIDFEDVAASGLTKKELLVLSREKAKLEKTLGGIREMQKVPSAVWIVDTKKEHIAVGEARKLNIPVVAILDTNCDPDEVDYKIPGNDDAIRSVTLLTRVIADAVAEGLISRSRVATGDKGEKAASEPLAEWERDLLEGEKKDEAPAAEAPAAEAPVAEAPAEAPAAEAAPAEEKAAEGEQA
ncbi:hypothetical protein GCM10023100_22450 [Actinocorallia cavernae]|uniref:Small ribosomal subunit protein uS2 n=5 Tax=Actinomycetes TaxID=1760 RepID=A0ABP5ZPP9_9ACTN